MSFFENSLNEDSLFKQIDLMSLYRSKGLTDQNKVSAYYWPKDGHHNSSGYKVMAEIIAQALKQKYPEYFLSQMENEIKTQD